LVGTKCTGASLLPRAMGTVVGAGSFGMLVDLTNLSHTCAAGGYAALSAARGTTPVPLAYSTSKTTRNGFGGGIQPGASLPRFNLASGKVASFWIEGTDVQAGTATSCHTATSLHVSVWGVSTPHPISAPFYWCGLLWLLPIVPGISGGIPAQSLSHYFGG
jgi:hypothetical protein